MLHALMPWYNPARIRMPDIFESCRAHYSGMALTIS
jgi:hypothetical protein